MSGGRFRYQQNRMDDIAREIEALIAQNGAPYAEKPDWETHYSPDIIERFKETVHALRQATEMVERIDYVVSGDDSEETFRERWAKEVRPYWRTEMPAEAPVEQP